MKIIPFKEYEEMWDKLKRQRVITNDMYPTYHMKEMTVQNNSGPGTPFKDEYDRLTYKVNNPDMPNCISYWGEDGLIYYYPDTPFNRQMKKDRGL